MRALLIDPVKKTVTEVNYSGPYTQIYEFIHASCFAMAGTLMCRDPGNIDSRDDMFVDDEGLFDPKFGWFKWNGYPNPLAGYGLLMGTDQAGETVDVKSTIEELGVEFGIIGKVGEKVAWLSDKGVFVEIPE